MNGIHEVTGSIPVWSTTLRLTLAALAATAGKPGKGSDTREGAEAAKRNERTAKAAPLSPPFLASDSAVKLQRADIDANYRPGPRSGSPRIILPHVTVISALPPFV